MVNYSLYNLFEYPQISLFLTNIDNYHLDNTFELIDILKNQTLKNIEIFILSKTQYYNNLIKNNSKTDNRIKYFISQKNDLLDNIFHLISKARGKFTLIINNLVTLHKYELEAFYNLTRGKTNNIFKFKTKNENVLYLIKTKIIRDLIDNDISFQNFNNVINFISSIPEPKLNYVSVGFCPNNYYTPYTYVAMISILNSKNYSTYISFYLIIPEDFNQNNIDFLSSLYEQYDHFNITFLKMDERYDKAFVSRYLTTHAYYRFSFGELIPYLNKMIYLDTDIIALKDLTQFYNLNFNENIMLGQPTLCNKSFKTGIYKINSGILLLNLKLMRKIKMEKKVLYIINNGFNDDYHDQNLINFYFYGLVGIFPPKYHSRVFKNYNEAKLFNKDIGNLYDNDYFYFENKYPTIRHYLYKTKPLYDNTTDREDWWYFARKSKYFIEKTDNLSNIFNFNYN